MKRLEHGSQSVFELHYHLILVIKYRGRVINDRVSGRLKGPFESVGSFHRITIGEWNHDIDQIHVMFRAKPDSDLSQFIDRYKSSSSRLIKRENPWMRRYLWKQYFWSGSYCLLTKGGATIDDIRRYIESQGK